MNDPKSPLDLKPDYIVCTCMGVMASELEQAIADGVTTYEELQDMFGVGTGCSSCVPEVEEMLEKARK